jgi:hypothetical protein
MRFLLHVRNVNMHCFEYNLQSGVCAVSFRLQSAEILCYMYRNSFFVSNFVWSSGFRFPDSMLYDWYVQGFRMFLCHVVTCSRLLYTLRRGNGYSSLLFHDSTHSMRELPVRVYQHQQTNTHYRVLRNPYDCYDLPHPSSSLANPEIRGLH